jgi:hypothetical protein
MIVVDSGRLPDIGIIIAAALAQDMLESCPYVEGYCGEHVQDYPDVIQKAGQLQSPVICTFYFMYLTLYLTPKFPDPILYNPAAAVAANDRRRNTTDREAREVAAAIAMRVAARRPISSSTTRVRIRRHLAQANAIAGPSTMPSQDQAPANQSPTQAEIELLTRLANGNGLSSYDAAGFIEKCDRCGHDFLGSFLLGHIILSHQ